jgi:molybdopterin synthase catalytic subunit
MDDIIHITEKPLEIEQVTSLVAAPGLGGVNMFVGVVRDQTKGKKVLRLEYEAYEPMALSEMGKIVDQVKQKWPTASIAIHHRVGILKVGEAAVVIAVATPHRDDAFSACKYAIDTLKQTVPIWKKEVFEDGEEWVSALP